MAGHYDHDFYADKISKILWELQEQPEISHLLRTLKKCADLKIVFDFNHDFLGLMCPTAEQFTSSDMCCCSGTIYIAGKSDAAIKGTLCHEIAHLVMLLIYKNNFKPYQCLDFEKKQNYGEVLKEQRIKYTRKWEYSAFF